LTSAGGRTAEAPQSDLRARRHPLSGLFYAGQQVITQLRVLDQEQQARG